MHHRKETISRPPFRESKVFQDLAILFVAFPLSIVNLQSEAFLVRKGSLSREGFGTYPTGRPSFVLLCSGKPT